MGLALWLIPSDESTRIALQRQINILSDPSSTHFSFSSSDKLPLTLSSPASAPFPPHATLISGIGKDDQWDDVEKIWTETLAALEEWRTAKEEVAEELECTFEDVTTRGLYFQCLLLALSLPSDLERLNQIMRIRFQKEDQPPYFPHISLLYAHISPEEAKRHIAHLRSTNWWSEQLASDQRVEVKEVGNRVRFGQVQLWDCNGPVAGWRRLKSTELMRLDRRSAFGNENSR